MSSSTLDTEQKEQEPTDSKQMETKNESSNDTTDPDCKDESTEETIKGSAENNTSKSESEALISDTESVGETEETKVQKITEKAKQILDKGDDNDQTAESEYSEEEVKKAAEYKDKGNEFFKVFKYTDAIEWYTEAIFCKIPDETKAVYYCNRSLANLRMENTSIALYDACDCVKMDPKNVKGYYRKGQAYVALRQMKEAVAEFKTVCRMQPQNRDAREKLGTTQKAHKEALLSAAIQYKDEKVEVNAQDIAVESSYTGPKFDSTDEIDAKWVESLMEWQKDQKTLHRKFATLIIQKATELFEAADTLVRITIDELEEVTVCGDIHGQFYDLLNIFKINGSPSEENPYVFNGDFIDRGSFSVEVIMTMLAWKVCFPQHFFMSRGNHEAKQLNKMYGFEGEVKKKYDMKTYDIFSQLFCMLPLAHCINGKVLVNHGGLYSKDGVKLSDIKNTNRKREPTDEGIMCEALWSDPCDQNGRHPSKRGVGVMFGPDIAEKFLEDNGLELLVRAHEVKPEGFEYQKGGKVLTIFSAPNYCDQMGNKGAFVRFLGADMKPKITSFEKVDHPKIPPMAYAQSWGSFF